MTRTIRRSVRVAMAFLAVGMMTVANVAPVVASHVVVRTSFPGAGTVGEPMQLAIDVRTPDGAPLPGTTVTYYLHMSFAGVEGETEIGRAVTDDQGVATIRYQPRAVGLHQMRMEFLAPGATTVEEVVATFDVAGGTQLYRSAGGIDIPGIGTGLLMMIVGAVWLVLLSVSVFLVAIARAGGATDPVAR